MWSNLAQKFFDLVKSSNFYAPSKYVQKPPFLVHDRVQRGMGRGPDVTSNPEHDDSVVRMFTCVCGKGRESSSKNSQPGAL